MRIKSSFLGIIVLGLILFIGSLSSCTPDIEKFQKTGFLVKRDISNCKCCGTEYFMALDSGRNELIPDLIVTDSVLSVNSFPNEFILPQDTSFPIKVSFDYENVKNSCRNSIDIKKINRIWDDKKSLQKGTAHFFIDSLKNNIKNNKILVSDANALYINQEKSTYSNNLLHLKCVLNGEDNDKKYVVFLLSINIYNPNNLYKFDAMRDYIEIFRWLPQDRYYRSYNCNYNDVNFYFTELDTINGYFSGKLDAKLCLIGNDTIQSDSVRIKGFFYKAKVDLL